MTVKELVKKNRSYRRFYEEKSISEETLRGLVDIGRMTPSGANAQPTRYLLSCTAQRNEKVFSCLRWAGYYKDWDGPDAGERPSGYIILISPAERNAAHDEGIIAQTILLAATEQGMGGCMLANIDRERLQTELDIPKEYAVRLALAIGYPKENVVVEEIPATGDIHYYRDAEQTHHVPKIRLEDLILS